MKVMRIKEILGGDLSSKNTKMPGTSFGLSTDYCNVGGKLREIEGSVCASCYARRLENIRPSVRKGWTNRAEAVLEATSDQRKQLEWIDAMVYRLKMLKPEYHRWHDSGDLLNDRHMSMIISVAQRCPEIAFWIPTKEKAIVKRALKAMGVHGFPPNLSVRVSEAMLDDIPEGKGKHLTPMSAVISKGTETGHWICPAPHQGNSCQECRACWHTDVEVVCYRKH